MKKLNRDKIALKFMLRLSVQYNNSVEFTTTRAYRLADEYIKKVKKNKL